MLGRAKGFSVVFDGESRPRRDGGRARRSAIVALALAVGWALLTCSQAQADLHATTVSVDCGPGVVVSQSATCTATVTDSEGEGTPSAPSGAVKFTSDSEGAFSPATCEPIPSAEAQSSCSVDYKPTAVGSGTHEITGAYGGDSVHAESSGSGALLVTLRMTLVSVDCGSGVVVGQSATCTATVSDNAEGTPSAPSGTVNFTSDVSGTSFGPSGSCALAPLSSGARSGCSVEYHSGQEAPRVHSITAAYGGDAVHAASSASTTLTVNAAPPASQSGGTTTTTAAGPVTEAAPGPVASRVTPKCRVRARERWRLVGGPRRRHKLEVPELLVTYACDQSAAVLVGGTVRIAAVRYNGKLTKPRTVKLPTVSSQAVIGRAQPGVVLALPAAVAKALRKGVRTEATVTFTVKNANGTGVGTIRFLILPPTRVPLRRG
jgi:hypothetical protein